MIKDKEKLNSDRPDENPQTENKEDIFQIEEIKIEEMAIDGICGVY